MNTSSNKIPTEGQARRVVTADVESWEHTQSRGDQLKRFTFETSSAHREGVSQSGDCFVTFIGVPIGLGVGYLRMNGCSNDKHVQLSVADRTISIMLSSHLAC